MPRVVLGRLLTLVLSLAGASVLIFLVVQALPGDLAQVMLGERATPAQIEALRERLGLNRPWVVRYLDWVGDMVRGDLGTSALSGLRVTDLVAGPIRVTGWLVLWSTLGSILVALPLGMWSALRRRHWDGFAVNALSQFGMAVPAFLAGILLVLVVAVRWGWLPANGYVPLARDPGEWARHLVLPVVSLVLVQGALLVRYVRSAFVEVLTEDHITTARSVGWTKLAALWRHGMRQAGLSLVTVLGLQVASLFVGAIVVENVFVLPGLGSMVLRAVVQRDFIVVQSVVMLLVVAVLVVNTVVDLLQAVLDPRIRAKEQR